MIVFQLPHCAVTTQSAVAPTSNLTKSERYLPKGARKKSTWFSSRQPCLNIQVWNQSCSNNEQV